MDLCAGGMLQCQCASPHCSSSHAEVCVHILLQVPPQSQEAGLLRGEKEYTLPSHKSHQRYSNSSEATTASITKGTSSFCCMGHLGSLVATNSKDLGKGSLCYKKQKFRETHATFTPANFRGSQIEPKLTEIFGFAGCFMVTSEKYTSEKQWLQEPGQCK